MDDVTEKATYKKIQEYVQEKYGFKVHTVYIAEVKRKHGLSMYEASNTVEKRKYDYVPCPANKVNAIEDALKYFGMLNMGYDFKEEYSLMKVFVHKCEKCGKRMHKAKDVEIENLPCPDCGTEN